RDVPAEPGAVLPARRGRRPARRREHRALLRHGAPDVRPDPVPLHHPQQDRDGTRTATDWRHHAGARRVTDRGRRPRGGAPDGGGGLMSSLGISILILAVSAIVA